MPKMTKRHKFVKNMIIENQIPHAHLQTRVKQFCRVSVNWIKDVAGFAGAVSESVRAVTLSKMAKSKI